LPTENLNPNKKPTATPATPPARRRKKADLRALNRAFALV
jgi:hypothetical protein